MNNATGSAETEIKVSVAGIDAVAFLGPSDTQLQKFETQHPGVKFFARGNELTLQGEQALVADAKAHLLQVIEQAKNPVKPGTILLAKGKSVRAQTAGQRKYLDAIDSHTITFGIGPAGTGKTFLAVAKAVAALQSREVSKIILTRPAVEAGERLGYLPGTLSEKIDPYLRPLFDAAATMLAPEIVTQLISSGAIEVAPLAYMRGRTLNESFVILDEAQNTTPDQMKMFLTRLGFGSRMVVTGDQTQADLPGGISGLRSVQKVLKDVDDISIQMLTSDDIVRHSLVGRIVDAYDRFEENRNNK